MNCERRSGAKGWGGARMVGGRIHKSRSLVALAILVIFLSAPRLSGWHCHIYRKAIDMHLQTPRLFLRDFTLDDFTAVHAYASLQETVRFMEWGPNTEEPTRD